MKKQDCIAYLILEQLCSERDVNKLVDAFAQIDMKDQSIEEFKTFELSIWDRRGPDGDCEVMIDVDIETGKQIFSAALSIISERKKQFGLE